MRIHRAGIEQQDLAYAINIEYMNAVGVVVRDDPTSFTRYFEDRAGFWLAQVEGGAVGCIGLRPLATVGPAACEIKRLYVKPDYRGQRLADRLLDTLEEYACACGYQEAYLDTKDDLVRAIQFYQRRGYLPCPRYNDNPQATLFMRRSLG